jgi:hypothetical protein
MQHSIEAEPWLREAYVPHRDLDMSEISGREAYSERTEEVLEVECILERAFNIGYLCLRNPFLPVQVKLRRGVLETFPWLISPLWGLVAQYAPAEQLKFQVLPRY